MPRYYEEAKRLNLIPDPGLFLTLWKVEALQKSLYILFCLKIIVSLFAKICSSIKLCKYTIYINIGKKENKPL